jgi:hypothetical protein
VLTGGGEERERPESGRRRSAMVVGGGLTRWWRSGAPPVMGSGSSAPTRRGGRDGGIDWLRLCSNRCSQRRIVSRLSSSPARFPAGRRRSGFCEAGWGGGGSAPALYGQIPRPRREHARRAERRRRHAAALLLAAGWASAGRLGRSGLGRAHGLGPIR